MEHCINLSLHVDYYLLHAYIYVAFIENSIAIPAARQAIDSQLVMLFLLSVSHSFLDFSNCPYSFSMS